MDAALEAVLFPRRPSLYPVTGCDFPQEGCRSYSSPRSCPSEPLPVPPLLGSAPEMRPSRHPFWPKDADARGEEQTGRGELLR
eukprot:1268211-Pyramimonas_sp.AAC.1